MTQITNDDNNQHLLSTLCLLVFQRLAHLIFTRTYEVAVISVPILQMKKLRH